MWAMMITFTFSNTIWALSSHCDLTVCLSQDKLVWEKMCLLYCDNPHVDFCDTHDLPNIGNLNKNFPVGRFWRFQVRSCHIGCLL